MYVPITLGTYMLNVCSHHIVDISTRKSQKWNTSNACKLQEFLILSIFFLLTTNCNFPFEKYKLLENFPRTILNWNNIELKPFKIFVNPIINILENIAVNANYMEVVRPSPLWAFNNRSSLKLWSCTRLSYLEQI